jgi:hypothetical protein
LTVSDVQYVGLEGGFEERLGEIGEFVSSQHKECSRGFVVLFEEDWIRL